MCPNATPVDESRPTIWDPPKIYNIWAFPSGCGKTSACTSLWVCLAPRVGITQYVSSWTAWLSQSTSYPYPPPTESDSIPSSTYHTLFAITVSRRPSSPIDNLSLLLAFGNNCISAWAPTSSKAQSIIPKLTDRLNESIKSFRICFVLMFWRMVENGTSTFY
jgi:hypothetical protein